MADPAGAAEPAAADWENCKENFQPLKAGRKPGALRDCTADLRRQAMEEQRRWWGRRGAPPAANPARGAPDTRCRAARRAFWEELAAYKGDDPLEVWLRCGAPRWRRLSAPAATNRARLLLEQPHRTPPAPPPTK